MLKIRHHERCEILECRSENMPDSAYLQSGVTVLRLHHPTAIFPEREGVEDRRLSAVVPTRDEGHATWLKLEGLRTKAFEVSQFHSADHDRGCAPGKSVSSVRNGTPV